MDKRNSSWSISQPDPADWPVLSSMVAARVRAQRKAVPVLPERGVSAEQIFPKVESLCRQGDVLVARENGRPVGFLGAWKIPMFMGDRGGLFVPEYGFGTDSLEPDHVCRVFEFLYNVQCGKWSASGALNHAIITYDEERHFRDKLFHGGFGGLVIDAIRPAVALHLPVPDNLRIRDVTADDTPAMRSWMKLVALHHDYMRAAPVMLGSAEASSGEELQAWIRAGKHHAWIAEDKAGNPLAYLQLQNGTDGTSMLVDDPRNMAITGAFTLPESRGNGVATLLLDAALTRAVEHGMTSVSVDFESRNWPAERFWTRHFTPFTFSVLRQVDARVV